MSIFKLSIRETLDRMTKKELTEYRDKLISGEVEGFTSEEEYEVIRLIGERINPKKGRPRKPADEKRDIPVKLNITPKEEAELLFIKNKLKYKHLSTYIRDMVFNVTPELQVRNIQRPECDSEMLEGINDDIQFTSLQLMHALQEGVIGQEAAQNIISHLSSIQQKIIEHEQRELNEYNAEFVLTLAEHHLSKEQLQKLADFKELREQAQYQ